MAQLDTGEVKLHPAPHAIQEVISGALDQCRPQLAGRDIELRIPANLPPVSVDLPRGCEVLKHLLENANQYSPAGAPITISAELSHNFVVTSVADRGSGIDESDLGLIFDKFYRGQDQRYRVQGTGMGLPIAKAIVEAHHGTMNVTTQLGHGSVFSFTLPVAQAAGPTT